MDNILQIKELESLSKCLEPDEKERKDLQQRVNQCAEDFLSQLPDLPMYQPSTDEGAGILEDPIGEEPSLPGDVMALFQKNVLEPGLNPAHSGHFGYIPGSGLYHSALGDFLAAVSNRYAGIYAASPGAVRMEQMLIQWLIRLFGYPDTAAGDLTSGGSIANLSAIVAARDKKGLSAKAYHRAVVYSTEHTHHCVEKAVRIAGLSDCKKRFVPVDAYFRMQPRALEQMIIKDREAGLIPWLLVGSAGTTDMGSVDPLNDLADIARDQNLWFHVDGAYGAAFVLCDQGRQILAGMERSDSLVVDPHKGFFVPFGTGVVLVREGVNLHRSFHYQANYMQDQKRLAKLDQMSPAELSPELSRHFRGVRLWLPLKLLGVKPFRAALAEKMLLAAYFYERIQGAEGIETGPVPDLSIVIFRYLPKTGDANAFNEKLIEKIMIHGRVFMSSTLIHGKVMLRLAVLSFRTHLEKVDEAITIVEEMIDHVKKELSVLKNNRDD